MADFSLYVHFLHIEGGLTT